MQATTSKASKIGRREELKQKLGSFPQLGQILTWSPGGGSHKFATIVQALKDVGLDHTIVKELLPRHAWTRACRKLDEERVIDHLKEDADIIVFQFTKKTMADDIWKYAKETNLTLNKTTGVVECSIPDLKTSAQREVYRCMEERTSNDLTKIVQRLFDQESDGCPLLFPIRDQGGAYFVFQEHAAFIDQVASFLHKIGGRLEGFPIADVTAVGGKNTAVTNTIASTLEAVMEEHKKNVEKFGLDTRQSTLQAAADAIQKTKQQIRALASHLGDKVDELEKFADNEDEKLKNRIEQLSQTRATTPSNETRALIFGHSITSVIRWMGKQGWSFKQCRWCLNGMGLGSTAEATIRAQLQAGKTGERGPAAPITGEQKEELWTTYKTEKARIKAEKENE